MLMALYALSARPARRCSASMSRCELKINIFEWLALPRRLRSLFSASPRHEDRERAGMAAPRTKCTAQSLLLGSFLHCYLLGLLAEWSRDQTRAEARFKIAR